MRPSTRRIVFRSAGHPWLIVAGTALGVVALLCLVAPPSAAQAVPSLIFERPAAQGPGTSGFQIVSDPTIRPFQAPGMPATISKTLPIDFQGNGRPDLLACHGSFPPAGNVPCRVLRPQPDGSVTEITRQMFGTGALPSRVGPQEMVTGDFNRDGRPDIFVAAFGYDTAPFSGETNILLISNADGTYTDRSATLPQTPDGSFSASVGDINGDGNLDIYVGSWSGNGAPVGPYFLMGRGDGTFTQKVTGLPSSMGFDPVRGETYSTCLLVDLDGDRYPDLVLGGAGDFYQHGSVVLYNDGTGDFTKRPRLVLPQGPLPAEDFLMHDIVSLDVNRDGRPDLLLLSSAQRSASDYGLQVLINQGNGTFADETVARLGTSSRVLGGSYCSVLRLADFNGDGWQDFYCADGPVDVPNRYWMGNGDGTWRPVAAGLLPPGLGLGTHAVDFDGDGRLDLVSITSFKTGDVQYQSYLNRTTRTAFATMSLSQSRLNFGAVNNGGVLTSQTPAQRLALTQSGPGTVTWTATASQPWISVSPTSGTGAATLQVSMANAGVALPPSGVLGGTITVTTTGATNSPDAAVFLSVLAPAQSAAPVGSFDTPPDNSTGVTGSVAVTGWALDDVGVRALRILRDPVPGESAAQVFMGNAVFVDGARPDVAASSPNTPLNTRAGWGYMMLTNFLPNQGNGRFKLSAYADDADGHTTLLGTRTITCTNNSATRPFGAIDTPAQGETIGGTTYNNFGWVLARGPARADPPNGTVQVVIDGVFGGAPVGWTSRSDLTTLFAAGTYPGVSNALGVSTFDTTALANGVHTIAWVVTADNGQADGIGSRYFTVANGSSSTAGARKLGSSGARATFVAGAEIGRAALQRTDILGRRGWDATTPYRTYAADGEGRVRIDSEELDRIELRLDPVRLPASAESLLKPREGGKADSTHSGYQRIGALLRPLPIGSHLDPASGVFTWQPGVGFVHAYDFVFVRCEGGACTTHEVRIVLHPKRSNHVGPQIEIDPLATRSRAQPVLVTGWAVDLDADTGTGVDAVHVWAYPVSGGDPQFVGVAAYGGTRPDADAVFGERFSQSGYEVTVDGLAPGTYDLAVFAWSTTAGRFAPARVTRLTIGPTR